MEKKSYQSWIICVLIMLIIIIIISNCTKVKELNYNTYCDQEEFLKIKDKNLAIILFDYNSESYTYGTPVDSSIAEALLKIHKYKFLSSFKSRFTLKDISSDSAINKKIQTIKSYNQNSIKEIIEEVNTDGAIIITNNYGYTMSSGPLIPALMKGILQKNLPKKTKQTTDFLFGPSNVDSYNFASNLYITNKQGNRIWNFHGKITALPEPFKMFKKPLDFLSEDFVDSFMGFDPSERTIIRAISIIVDQYLDYTNWLVMQDFQGSEKKNYFIDYPKEKRNKYISIYPVSK